MPRSLARVLVVGGGGREHALSWSLALSPRVEQVYVTPGNGGTALEERVRNIAVRPSDAEAVGTSARGNGSTASGLFPSAATHRSSVSPE